MVNRFSSTIAAALLLASGCSAMTSRSASSGPSAVVATIPLSDFGTGIALTPDGTRAYVAAGSKVLVVDVATNQVASTIDVGDMPYAIAISGDGQRGYVTDLMQREVWMLDLVSNSVVKRVDLGEPRRPVLRPGVAVSPDGSKVYATISQPEGAGFDLLYTIDARSGAQQQHALDFHPGDLVAGRDGRLWIVGCRGLCSDGALHGVDPANPGHAVQLTLPTVPGQIAIAADGAHAYVANGLDASVSVADLRASAIVKNVRVGAEPLGVATSPDGTRIYVTNFQSNTLSVIDAATNTVTGQLNVGPTPRALAITPDGRFAYVTHSTPQLSVVDLSKVE